MKTIYFLLICILFSSSYVYAEDVARHTGQLYEGCTTISDSRIWLNNKDDISSAKDGFIYVPSGCGSLPNVAQKYLKVVSGEVVEMSQAEKDTLDANEAAFALVELTAQSRLEAKGSVDQLSPEGVRLRAALLVILDEMNLLRQWLASFKTEVAAASNLADLKTRVATLPATPDRTATQLKNAIKSRIDAGNADA